MLFLVVSTLEKFYFQNCFCFARDKFIKFQEIKCFSKSRIKKHSLFSFVFVENNKSYVYS
jgi:hypothetical protein